LQLTLLPNSNFFAQIAICSPYPVCWLPTRKIMCTKSRCLYWLQMHTTAKNKMTTSHTLDTWPCVRLEDNAQHGGHCHSSGTLRLFTTTIGIDPFLVLWGSSASIMDICARGCRPPKARPPRLLCVHYLTRSTAVVEWADRTYCVVWNSCSLHAGHCYSRPGNFKFGNFGERLWGLRVGLGGLKLSSEDTSYSLVQIFWCRMYHLATMHSIADRRTDRQTDKQTTMSRQ